MSWRLTGEWRYSSTILDLGTRWRWVASFMPRPLYPRGNSRRYPLDRWLFRPQGRPGPSGVEKKSPAPANNRTPILQAGAHRYTDWTTRPKTEIQVYFLLVGLPKAQFQLYICISHIPSLFREVTSSEILTYCFINIANVYGPDDRGVGARVPVGARLFFSSCCPDRFWGPPSLLSNGYQGLFLRW
jgi:hypothetical protein